MAVLSVYTAGVSTTGIECINEAVKLAFGECSVEELGKENLKYKVRTGYRDSSVVLIVLDETAELTCKDIENGLYNSTKYYAYKDDKSLVKFLNETYDLNMEIPEDISSVDSDILSNSSNIINDDVLDMVSNYKSQLEDKDNIIKTLNYKIKELNNIIYNEGYSSDLNDNSDEEVLHLKNTISDMDKVISDLKDKLNLVKGKNAELTTSLESYEKKYNKVKNNFDIIQKDLAEERVNSSQKSAVIHDNEKEIEKLKGLNISLNDKISLVEKEREKIDDLKSSVRNLKNENYNLSLDIKVKSSEIDRLSQVLKNKNDVSEQLLKYKNALSDTEVKKTDLEKELSALKGSYDDVVEKLEKSTDSISALESELESLQGKLSASEKYLAQANSDKISLQEKIKVLELSENRDANIESTLAELSELRKKYSELKLNIFNNIADKSLPHSNIKVPVFRGVIEKLKNVKFIFSGSTESRKGTYKCLFSEFSKNMDSKYLLVDVTSETAIDYVFQMHKVVDGVGWFESGGGVQKYLSSTCLANTKVLMPSIRYINDSYFLTVDWEKRLKELENSGYKVIVYCGDLSNLVSRVLFEAFTEVGNSLVYVHGNAIGSRSMIVNGSGLSGISKCSIAYYDFDKNVSRFYDIMCKRCKCSIVSYAR